MGRFLESMGCVAAYAACLGIAMVGVGCGGEDTRDSRGTRVEGTEPGDCEDGADNDADGLFDCADPSCEASPLCDGGAGGNSGTGGVGGSVLCADVDCDDQNECTAGTCNPTDGECAHTHVTDGTSCDFEGLPGVCTTGVCEDAMLCASVNCDDGNQCTEDSCDPMDGTCGSTNASDGATCDFGGLPGVCTAGVCEDAMLCAGVDCDDSDQCTQDVCNPMDGQCLYANATDGTACDFGGLPGVCTAGVCEDVGLVFCNNPDAAAPSCSLAGFSRADDSAIRSKLEGCAVAGCHGAGAVTFTMDLATASVEAALAPLSNQIGVNGNPLVDQFYPDCSDMLTKVTDGWGAGQRMPLGGTPWSGAEIDCFRSYLNEIGN